MLRPLAVAGVVLAATSGAVDAQSRIRQAPAIQRVQATPPSEGATGWGRDNCYYIFRGGSWRSADYCRVMRSATVYDTYKPSTRTWVSRMDESVPGWIGVRDAASGAQFKFATNGSVILRFDGRQWVDVTALLRNAAQTRTTGQAQYDAIVAKNKADPALQAQIAQAQGMIAASNARMAGTWTAPNCNASYNGCR